MVPGKLIPVPERLKKKEMESFRYHDLGRIAYADALEYQTAAFEVLLDAKATGKKEDNQLFFCEHLPVLTIGKSGKDSNLLIPEETLREREVSFYHINRGGGYNVSRAGTDYRLSGI